MAKDINVVIAGSAGEGIQTVGSIFSKAVAKYGYSVFSWQEYESRIRGGLNSYSIRISTTSRNAPRQDADILLPLRKEAMEKYLPWLRKDGILITDSKKKPETFKGSSVSVPFSEIAKEKWKNPVYANTISIGALWAVIGGKFEVLKEVLEETFKDKPEAVLRDNLGAAYDGYDYAEKACIGVCPWHLEKQPTSYYLISGNPALALGAAIAGCKFMTAYPMTPSTGIITFLAQHQDKLKILVEQAEDEIAAINMAIGAQFAGARAMTATSGGGFALMVEGISLAGMVEVPVVVVLAQRPGPATGLPTRTAQGDLLFAIHAGHGEFPKAVLAPSDPLDGFYKMIKAFELADKYQIPVIVMTDQFFADSQFSIENFEFPKEIKFFLANPEEFTTYKRYLITESGISPRLYPGQSKHLVTADSDEHDEEGHITEELESRALPMMNKRLRKAELLKKEINPPELFRTEDASEIFVGWGSTKNAIFEAVELLREEGKSVGAVHFTEVWPMPYLDEKTFPFGKPITVIEQNGTSQFSTLLRREYNISVNRTILRYEGLPITAEYIRRHYNG